MTDDKKKISLRLAQEQGWEVIERDSTTTRLGKRFEPLNPLSWTDGGELYERGMNAVAVLLECENSVLRNTVFFGEFTPCSGRAIGGKAPAWILPSMPLDQIGEDELPPSVAASIEEAIQSICESHGSAQDSIPKAQGGRNKITSIEYLDDEHVAIGVRDPVSPHRLVFMQRGEAGSHPLAQVLLQVEHIVRVELNGTEIILQKAPEGSWSVMLPLLAVPIRDNEIR